MKSYCKPFNPPAAHASSRVGLPILVRTVWFVGTGQSSELHPDSMTPCNTAVNSTEGASKRSFRHINCFSSCSIEAEHGLHSAGELTKGIGPRRFETTILCSGICPYSTNNS